VHAGPFVKCATRGTRREQRVWQKYHSCIPTRNSLLCSLPCQKNTRNPVAAGVRKWREFPGATLPSSATAKSLILLDLVRK